MKWTVAWCSAVKKRPTNQPTKRTEYVDFDGMKTEFIGPSIHAVECGRVCVCVCKHAKLQKLRKHLNYLWMVLFLALDCLHSIYSKVCWMLTHRLDQLMARKRGVKVAGKRKKRRQDRVRKKKSEEHYCGAEVMKKNKRTAWKNANWFLFAFTNFWYALYECSSIKDRRKWVKFVLAGP